MRVALRTAMVVAPPLALASWLVQSERFQLQSLGIPETDRVEIEWVVERLTPELGQNLFLLPLSRVEKRLQGHPWVERVVVRKQLPQALVVTIEERSAAAVLETREALFFVDRSGRRIAPVPDGEVADSWVRLTGSDGPGGELSTAMALAEERCLEKAIKLNSGLAASALPGRWKRLARIEVVGEDDFRLYAEDLSFPVLVRSADGVARAERLQGLLPEILDRADEVGEVDLRFRGRVIVRSGPSGNWQAVKET
jgi:cell division protein FtsQ